MQATIAERVHLSSPREDVMNLPTVSHAPIGLTREEALAHEMSPAQSPFSEIARKVAYNAGKVGHLLNGFSLAVVLVQSLVGTFPGSETPPFAERSRRSR